MTHSPEMISAGVRPRACTMRKVNKTLVYFDVKYLNYKLVLVYVRIYSKQARDTIAFIAGVGPMEFVSSHLFVQLFHYS
jgi:hypothetical protein